MEYALVVRARRGDTRAFERLYRLHAGRVNGLCLRLTRDPALAEDCVQETFIRAWRALERFEARSRVSTWLHRIAVNVVLERRRRRSEELEVTMDPQDMPYESALPDTPVEEAEIEAAIDSLPQGARDALTLCGIYGYGHQEAASMLGVAEGTCKAQLHRARALVRRRLEEGIVR
jgi:RNA polymerase sigma-70 factor (ECF subfamily)